MSKYGDSNPLYAIEKGYKESTRFLMFHSTQIEAEQLQEALDIIGGYNDFDSKKVGQALLEMFGEDCRYIVGREYSVVVYVVPKHTELHFWVDDLVTIKEKAVIDEVAVVNGRLRLWWD